jgi:acyl carrier protein
LFKNLDVTFNRMPNIGFGNFDRDKQVLDLLLENAPIKTEELSLLFEHKYGMKDASSIYFGCIRKYVDNGIYNIDFKDVTPEEECVLREILNCDVVPLDRVKDEFAAKFPNEDLEKINNYNLRKFGYRISYNLVYNNEYGSLELLIKNNILSQDTIDLSTDHLLFRHDAMYRSLLAHKRAYEIVEFARRKFINIKKLETFGISKEMLHDFAQSARACANSRYFTLYNLKQRGFCHELFEFGFEDYFYESVLRYSPLFKFFSCGRGSSCIFTESNDLTVDDMLKMILMDKGSMHIQDMIDYLEQEYGVSFEKNTLRKRLRHSTLYYSDATEKIYYDDFSGEI